MEERIKTVLEYHTRTKHHYSSYARGPEFLDWKNRPEPFRRYSGAEIIRLDKPSNDLSPPYERALCLGQIPAQSLNSSSVSQLFFDSLAVSAWKSIGSERWALRVNPSSGNLHPTEGYIICNAISGILDTPAVFHYAPDEHVLEVRATISKDLWDALTHQLPENVLLFGLTSIFWREAWKYGERAFRYCQHDIGHAIAAISIAAIGLGWEAKIMDGLSSHQIAILLGVQQESGPNAEYPEVLMAIYPQGTTLNTHALPAVAVAQFEHLKWQGVSNKLSSSYRNWPIIRDVSLAVRKQEGQVSESSWRASDRKFPVDDLNHCPDKPTLREIVRKRRSAVAMDGQTRISQDNFYKILRSTLSYPNRVPFQVLPWESQVHLVIFIHQVDGLTPGIYLLIRNINQLQPLQNVLQTEFSWEKVLSNPYELKLFRLAVGDVRLLARQISCRQDIAAFGCFSLGMISRFETALRENGAWFYPHLFWECGIIGQMLYLEAETVGLRGTGIGCYFDDGMHSVLSINNYEYQDLYHFTIGGPLEDVRLTTLPAYPDLD